MIPTSIDGTDITGATIDGTDVQEITVDGQTVFSAATVFNFDDGTFQGWTANPVNMPGSNNTSISSSQSFSSPNSLLTEDPDGGDSGGSAEISYSFTNSINITLKAYIDAVLKFRVASVTLSTSTVPDRQFTGGWSMYWESGTLEFYENGNLIGSTGYSHSPGWIDMSINYDGTTITYEWDGNSQSASTSLPQTGVLTILASAGGQGLIDVYWDDIVVNTT